MKKIFWLNLAVSFLFFLGFWSSPLMGQDVGITLVNSEYQSEQILSFPIAVPIELEPVPCEGNNYVNNIFLDNWLMGGPIVAISWIPSSSVTISRIEVFTGEVSEKINALAIWSDDGGGPSKPLAMLGYTNDYLVDYANSWQGADLIAPVSVSAGTKYWVVWDPAGGEQAPITDDPDDIQQTYWGSYSGTVTGRTSWYGPFSFSDHRWKFRMFCAVEVNVDIKPMSCPNPLNIKSRGVLPIAILGTENLDVSAINPASIRLEGIAPIRSGLEDVSRPVADREEICKCSTDGPDGFMDLTLKFSTQEIVGALGEISDREVLVLTLTGELTDRSSIKGQDCVLILSK